MRGRSTKLLLRILDSLLRPLRDNRSPAAPHLRTGRKGEEEAYFYLRRQGYTIVARNFRSPRHRGEVDLIGWDGDVLCFVEVKTRTTRDVKPAEAAVDEHKQRELAAVARDYWRRVPASAAPVAAQVAPGAVQRPANFRFDIVSVYCENENSPDIRLFKNAFIVP